MTSRHDAKPWAGAVAAAALIAGLAAGPALAQGTPGGSPGEETRTPGMGAQQEREMQPGAAPGAGEQPEVTTEQVREIQQGLQREGHDPGQIDGHWGPNTANALMEFQRARGLDATGRPDQETLQALGVSDRPGLGIGEPERGAPDRPAEPGARDTAPAEQERMDQPPGGAQR